MEWNYNSTKEQYEIYQDGEKRAIIPENIASEVEAIVPGLGRVAITQVTEDNSQESPSGTRESLSHTQNGIESTVGLTRADMPDIPNGTNLKTDADREYYNRLAENPTSQPAQYRRAIREHGRISRIQFDGLAEDMGYNPDAGAHNASLLMLERIGEINRDGRGDNQSISWTGNNNDDDDGQTARL